MCFCASTASCYHAIATVNAHSGFRGAQPCHSEPRRRRGTSRLSIAPAFARKRALHLRGPSARFASLSRINAIIGRRTSPPVAATPSSQEVSAPKAFGAMIRPHQTVRGRDSRRGRREHFRRRGRRRYGQPIAPLPTALTRRSELETPAIILAQFRQPIRELPFRACRRTKDRACRAIGLPVSPEA